MTQYTARQISVVTADLQAAANLQAKTVDPAGGNAFTVGLSPTGLRPATHYWCNWALDPADRSLLSSLLLVLPLAGIKVNLYDLDDADSERGRPSPQTVLATLGLQVVAKS